MTISCLPDSPRNSSYSVSKVPIASSRGISAHRARMRVVFPADIGPDTATLHAARTAAASRFSHAGLMQSRSTHACQAVDLQPVAADHDRRAADHPRGRGQAGAAVELHVQPRDALRERARVRLAAVGQKPQELDQLLIAVGHRRPLDPAAVDPLEQDLAAAEDEDVLHPVVINQWLQPPQPEHRVEHGLRHDRTLPRRPRRCPGSDRVGGVLAAADPRSPPTRTVPARPGPSGSGPARPRPPPPPLGLASRRREPAPAGWPPRSGRPPPGPSRSRPAPAGDPRWWWPSAGAVAVCRRRTSSSGTAGPGLRRWTHREAATHPARTVRRGGEQRRQGRGVCRVAVRDDRFAAHRCPPPAACSCSSLTRIRPVIALRAPR